MHKQYKHIDEMVQSKINDLDVDTTQMLADFSAIENALPTAPPMGAASYKPTKPLSWFSANSTLLGIVGVTLITAVTFFFAKSYNNNKSKTVKPLEAALVKAKDSIPNQLEDSVVIVDKIPTDPATAPKKWKYKMTIDFDKNASKAVKISDKKFIDISNKLDKTNSDVPKTKEESSVIIENFLDQIKPLTQTFTIDAEKENIIVCKDGTEISIQPFTFENASKIKIQGKVDLEVREAYSYSETIASGLHTMSNGKLLQSGGMIYINAKQQNERLYININNPIAVTMPTTNKQDSMQLFNLSNNNWLANGQWQRKFSDKFERHPITFINYDDNVHREYTNKKGQSVAVYKIPKDSKLTTEEAKAMMNKSYNKWYDTIIIKRSNKTEQKLHKWTDTYGFRPGIIGDTMSLKFETAKAWRLLSQSDIENYYSQVIIDSLAFLKNYEYSKSQYEIEEKTVGKYLFSLRNFGWINCDRFQREKQLKNIEVKLNELTYNSNNYKIVLLFPKLQSVMNVYYYENKFTATGIPSNTNVTIIAFKVENNKTLTSIQNFNTSNTEAKLENFIELTPAQVKAKLDALGSLQ